MPEEKFIRRVPLSFCIIEIDERIGAIFTIDAHRRIRFQMQFQQALRCPVERETCTHFVAHICRSTEHMNRCLWMMDINSLVMLVIGKLAVGDYFIEMARFEPEIFIGILHFYQLRICKPSISHRLFHIPLDNHCRNW